MQNTFRATLARRLRAVMLGLGLALAGTSWGAGPALAQTKFPSAEEAAAALAKAAGANDMAALRIILGPEADRLVGSGDPIADKAAGAGFAASYAAKHALTPGPQGQMTLTVGENDWPLPIPLMQVAGGWQFDSAAGAEELVNRRIGRNELWTIRALLAAALAQKDYFDRAQRGSGSGFYAQRVLSTPGKMDGLYWEADTDEAPSPLAPLVQLALEEGYPGATSRSGQLVPYHGYFYRILKAQGPSAPGGAKEYVRNGQMSGGFAFLAWPSRYNSSGVMSFMVGPDGVVYQRDLGPGTAEVASRITRFDPTLAWVPVKLTD